MILASAKKFLANKGKLIVRPRRNKVEHKLTLWEDSLYALMYSTSNQVFPSYNITSVLATNTGPLPRYSEDYRNNFFRTYKNSLGYIKKRNSKDAYLAAHLCAEMMLKNILVKYVATLANNGVHIQSTHSSKDFGHDYIQILTFLEKHIPQLRNSSQSLALKNSTTICRGTFQSWEKARYNGISGQGHIPQVQGLVNSIRDYYIFVRTFGSF